MYILSHMHLPTSETRFSQFFKLDQRLQNRIYGAIKGKSKSNNGRNESSWLPHQHMPNCHICFCQRQRTLTRVTPLTHSQQPFIKSPPSLSHSNSDSQTLLPLPQFSSITPNLTTLSFSQFP